jgi:hypothetical protein
MRGGRQRGIGKGEGKRQSTVEGKGKVRGTERYFQAGKEVKSEYFDGFVAGSRYFCQKIRSWCLLPWGGRGRGGVGWGWVGDIVNGDCDPTGATLCSGVLGGQGVHLYI